MVKIVFLISALLLVTLISSQTTQSADKNRADGISVYPENPCYWQYKGQPVLLLGASSNDNLFQQSFAGLDEELDKLVSHGGNYLRCTLSSRDEGDEYPFHRNTKTGLFDLDKWNDSYWKKFEYFLQATHKREIIAQIEIWATYDFYSRTSHAISGKTAWERNPFNPANNSNYDTWQSGLSELFESHGQSLINPFFNTTIPLAEPFDFNIQPILLGYQQKFVDKLLSISLQYDNVLYCMDNETQADPKWSIYWAQYVRKKAAEQNQVIETTEMFDPFDPTGGAVEGVQTQNQFTHFFMSRSNVNVALSRPEVFTFLDISNHNAQVGQVHYETAHYIWKKVQESGVLRPVNNVKIYGAGEGGWNGSAVDGQERFWRNIFAGAATVRFHRQETGLGNSDVALSHVKSMRMLTGEMDLFRHKPSNHLLTNREENEAYCLASEGKEYAIYFTGKGEVGLNVPNGKYEARWLNIRSSKWLNPETLENSQIIKTPDNTQWVVLIRKI